VDFPFMCIILLYNNEYGILPLYINKTGDTK